MRVLTILLLLVVLCFSTSFHTLTPVSKVYGVSLNTGLGNNLVTYYLGYFNGDKKLGQTPMDRTSFINAIRGKTESPGNPNRDNLFITNKVPDCGYYIDCTYFEKNPLTKDSIFTYFESLYCIPLDSVWKIKHKINPFTLEKGWAKNKYTPSDKQIEIIKKYGVNHWKNIIWGDKFYELLIHVSSYNWKESYKAEVMPPQLK
jgi:hypothetical protein